MYKRQDEDYYEQVYSPAQLIEGLYETKFNKSFALISAWGKLYKRTLFEDLLFPKGQIGEDGFFNLKAYLMLSLIHIFLLKSRRKSNSQVLTTSSWKKPISRLRKRLSL